MAPVVTGEANAIGYVLVFGRGGGMKVMYPAPDLGVEEGKRMLVGVALCIVGVVYSLKERAVLVKLLV